MLWKFGKIRHALDSDGQLAFITPVAFLTTMYTLSHQRVWTPSSRFVMQLCKLPRWFRRRLAIRFDRAFGAIESNCPSSSKSSRSKFAKVTWRKRDEGVHTLDGTEDRIKVQIRSAGLQSTSTWRRMHRRRCCARSVRSRFETSPTWKRTCDVISTIDRSTAVTVRSRLNICPNVTNELLSKLYFSFLGMRCGGHEQAHFAFAQRCCRCAYGDRKSARSWRTSTLLHISEPIEVMELSVISISSRNRQFFRDFVWKNTILCSTENVDTLVTFVMATFRRLRDDFDDGQLPSTRSNPTARRRRNHLEVCKSCMTKVTWVSILSMGQTYSYTRVARNATSDVTVFAVADRPGVWCGSSLTERTCLMAERREQAHSAHLGPC